MKHGAILTSSDAPISAINELQSSIDKLNEATLSTLGKIDSAITGLDDQKSRLLSASQQISAINLDSVGSGLSAVRQDVDNANLSCNAAYAKIVTAGQWIAQYNTVVNSTTSKLPDCESAIQTANSAITAHATAAPDKVHGNIEILNQPYYDSNGNVVGRSTIAFYVESQHWTAPADPNPSGPPKYPRFTCNTGQGLGRQNSYAGAAQDQPEATWETCTVAGDTPFKFIWQFKTVGTTAWVDFSEPTAWANTGHNKIDKVQTVSITTPYFRLGDAAWTTMRQSKIVIQPHTRDEHGITHIFDVRCIVISQATEFSDEANLIPSFGYAELNDGSLYSKDETNSLVIATALYQAGYLDYREKTRYIRALKEYVNSPYHLRVFMGYHSIGPLIARTASWPAPFPTLALTCWHEIENVAVGRNHAVIRHALQAILAAIGLLLGGKPAFSRQYAYYARRMKRRVLNRHASNPRKFDS